LKIYYTGIVYRQKPNLEEIGSPQEPWTTELIIDPLRTVVKVTRRSRAIYGFLLVGSYAPNSKEQSLPPQEGLSKSRIIE